MTPRGPAPRGLVGALAAGYVALLAIGLGSLWGARRATIAALDTPLAREQWQQWKADETAREASGTGPVRRRAPRADEPPGLVLMRDSFPGIVLGSAAVGSFLYGFLAWMVVEMARGKPAPTPAAPRPDPELAP